MSVDELLPAWLGRQRWFSGPAPASAAVLARDDLGGGLHRLLVEAGGARYQVLLGMRPSQESPDFSGRDHELVGHVDGHVVFEATGDADLARRLLAEVVPGEDAATVRPVGAEQSNTSLVYDDRLIVKLFRRLHDGPNPDAEVTAALAAVGFDHVAAPVGVWRHGDVDLAVCSPFLAGASEGWALALISLRDLFGSACDDPGECGGDFAAEARRLGQVTAEMHLALARAFGAGTGETAVWAAAVEAQVDRLAPGDAAPAQVAAFLARLRSVPAPGTALRVHGDYHLGQVMRTDAGWYVLDFEGEPARSLAERRRPSSPLKDVAGMLRSFDYAAQVALRERAEAKQDEHSPRARAWEERNRAAFLRGYEGTEGIDALLPPAGPGRDAVLAAFELDKAVYEVLYERAHRPEWTEIPMAAVRRLLDG